VIHDAENHSFSFIKDVLRTMTLAMLTKAAAKMVMWLFTHSSRPSSIVSLAGKWKESDQCLANVHEDGSCGSPRDP
jgi:hypothetical protein